MRAEQRAKGLPMRYDGRWRDRDPAEAPAGMTPVIRLKAPQTGETRDRRPGAGRGPGRQRPARRHGAAARRRHADLHAVGRRRRHRHGHHPRHPRRRPPDQRLPPGCSSTRPWARTPPRFAHIPLIHGPDGAKLSKRHGALAVTDTARWASCPRRCATTCCAWAGAHGDDEIISTEQAIAWFDLDGVGRSPARFDMAKLLSVNAHWLRERPTTIWWQLVEPFLADLGLAPGRAGAQPAAGRHERAEGSGRAPWSSWRPSAAFYVRPRPHPARRQGRSRSLAEARAPLLASWSVPLAARRMGRGRAREHVPADSRKRWAWASASWRSRCVRR